MDEAKSFRVTQECLDTFVNCAKKSGPEFFPSLSIPVGRVCDLV